MTAVGRSLCGVGVALAILAVSGCGRQSAPPNVPAPSNAGAAPVNVEPQVIVVDTPTPPPKFKEELTKPVEDIRRMWANFGVRQDPRATSSLMQELYYVKEGFAELEPSTYNEPCPWYKVRLNSQQAKLDAIRFRNLSDMGADLVWTFAVSREVFDSGMSWGIKQGPNVLGAEFSAGHLKRRLALSEIGLPDDNCVVFQQLEGGRIQYSAHCFIWFMTENYTEPYDVYVKLKLIDTRSTKVPTATRPQDLAPYVGFKLPFELNSSATVVDRAQDVAQNQGVDAGLQMLEQELAASPGRETQYAYADLAQFHALSVEGHNLEGAAPYFQKSAEAMRKIKQANPSLTTQEQDMLKVALYNEARSLARRGKTDQAMQVLEEAVENGMLDAVWIRSDEGLKSLHALPAFDALLRKLEEGM